MISSVLSFLGGALLLVLILAGVVLACVAACAVVVGVLGCVYRLLPDAAQDRIDEVMFW